MGLAKAPLAGVLLFALLTCGAAMDSPARKGAPAAQTQSSNPAAAETQLPVLFFSSDLNSYLEPCGCALYQMGGLARRATFFDQTDGDQLRLENGNLLRAGSPQDHIKMETILEVLGTLQYHAVNVGVMDLVFGVEELKAYAEYYQVPLLGGNLVSLDTGEAVLPAFFDIPLGEHQVRVIGLMAEGRREEVQLLGLDLLPAQDALIQAMEAPSESGQAPDHVVLMFQGPEVELGDQFKELSGLNAILTADDGESPFVVDHHFEGIPVLYSGKDGKQVGGARLQPDGSLSRIYAHDLEHTIADRTDVRQILNNYLDRINNEDLLGQLGKYTFPDGNAYLGTPVCGSCHPQELAIWEKSKHAKAWETLQRVRHDRDPECVSCHVVGLDKESGFTSWPESAGLEDVGCESCHGPGLLHVERQEKMPYLEGDKACLTCHVPDHSPKFDPQVYLPQIKHWD